MSRRCPILAGEGKCLSELVKEIRRRRIRRTTRRKRNIYHRLLSDTTDRTSGCVATSLPCRKPVGVTARFIHPLRQHTVGRTGACCGIIHGIRTRNTSTIQRPCRSPHALTPVQIPVSSNVGHTHIRI